MQSLTMSYVTGLLRDEDQVNRIYKLAIAAASLVMLFGSTMVNVLMSAWKITLASSVHCRCCPSRPVGQC